MVLESDFKVELVEAHTKKPFKEHYKDGEHYVEIEPDTEYYVSIQRVATQLKQDSVVWFFVDGHYLNQQYIWSGVAETEEESSHFGLFEEGKGEQALLFAKPSKLNVAGSASVRSAKVGKVEVKSFEGSDHESDYAKSCIAKSEEGDGFGRLTVTPCLGTTKVVQTGIGDTTEATELEYGTVFAGKLLHTITLKYRTVPGLIRDGVLPRPANIYTQYNTMNGKQNRPIRPLKVQPTRFSDERGYKHWEEFDLTNMNSDSDDDDSNDAQEEKREQGQKKEEKEATQKSQPGGQQRKRPAKSQEMPNLLHEAQQNKNPKKY